MRLLFDLGNTRLKWAIEKSGQLSDHGSLAHSDVNEASLDAQLSPSAVPSSVWLSSVAPRAIEALVEGWISMRFNLDVNRAVVTKQACDIKNSYANLTQLGVDRWMAALGARKFCPKGSVILVDAGTAITVDVLTTVDVYLGGAIMPGASLMHDSLISRTAGIASSFTGANRLIGTTTQECVNSGVQYGLVGAVDRVVSQMVTELKSDNAGALVNKLITGGDADLIMQNAAVDYRCVKDLVLHGLAAVAETV